MTKRREVYFEYESVTDKPTKGNIYFSLRFFTVCPILGAYDFILFLAEIEVLCSRAARLSYLSPFELSQAINEVGFKLPDWLPVIGRSLTQMPTNQHELGNR